MSFADAERRSRRLAARLLAAGLGKGDHVGLLYPQGIDLVVGLLAVTRMGAVAVPLSTFYRDQELRTAVRHADVDTLLTTSALAVRLELEELPLLRRVWVDGGGEEDGAVSDELLRAVEERVVPADPLVIISTSGATAEPKAVVHSHGAQVRQSWEVARLFEVDEATRTFTNMPFFWIGGLTVGLLGHLHVGGAVFTVERMDTTVMLDLVEAERPNRLQGWTLVERMRADPTFATRALPDRSLFDPPGPRHGSLGMTETGGPHTAVRASENATDLPEELAGSFGRPVPGMAHRIVDPATGAHLPEGEEGEICVRGPNLMLGLYGKERHEVFDEDGWFHTGDRGCFRDGYLFFTGRLTEMIKTGGANVAPREVELAVQELPGVQGAFVVGMPDADRGEVVGCLVGSEPGAVLEPDALLAELRERLSTYKVPRRLVVVPYDELPFLPSGKLSRERITDLLTR